MVFEILGRAASWNSQAKEKTSLLCLSVLIIVSSSIPLPMDAWSAGRQLGPHPAPSSFLKLHASSEPSTYYLRVIEPTPIIHTVNNLPS